MLVQRGDIGRPMGIGSPWPWQKDVEAFVEACQSKFCCYYVVVDGGRSKRIGRDNAGGGRGCTELVSSPYNAQLLFQIELYQFILNLLIETDMLLNLDVFKVAFVYCM